MSEVTAVLQRINAGDDAAQGQLLTLVYQQLRGLAAGYAGRGSRGRQLQATELVHEAWMRLAASETDWANRGHFMAVAATAMRQILVDHARRHQSQKRGGDWAQVTLTGIEGRAGDDPTDLLALDAALVQLASLDARRARVVEMRAFAGMSHPEIAAALGVSLRTVEGDWRFAKAWLARLLSASDAR